MKDFSVLTIAMDHTYFLKDSDGEVYAFPPETQLSQQALKEALKDFVFRIREKAQHRKVVILSEILSPYSHPVPVEASWWYEFLGDLAKPKASVKIINGRGTTVPFCSACNMRVSIYFIKYDNWCCPHCGVKHDSTDNILKNMIRDYAFFQEGETKLSKTKKKKLESDTSELSYLFSKIQSESLSRTESYEIHTDKKSHRLLRAMDRVCRSIRSDITKSIKESYPGDLPKVDYRGWVDSWNDNHGIFSQYRKANNGAIAYLSVVDTIISFCRFINKENKLPSFDEPVWVVYWRNVIVDKNSKRISLPRFRGRYFQLPERAIIPEENCFVEISFTTDIKMMLRFVLGGNHPLKQETIDGKHYRGRHRRNTREPRLKFIDEE